MIIRCLAKKEGDKYLAMSLDFGLAAQANSLPDAKRKLQQQVHEYIEEAHTTDVDNKEYLLGRKGPLSWFFIYYLLKLVGNIKLQFKAFSFQDPKPRTC
jgi:hypothetical protein